MDKVETRTDGARRSEGSSLSQSVHIIPLGVEFDRAILPFLAHAGGAPFFHAHRVHLLSPVTGHSRAFLAKVEQAFRPMAQVERHLVQRTDPKTGRLVEFEQVLRLVSRICLEELGKGNRVHINLSTGTKLIALAAGLAAMAHIRKNNGSTYYVIPADLSRSEEEIVQHGLRKGIIDVQEIELVPLLLPEPLRLRTLVFLDVRSEPAVEYRELLRFLASIPHSGYEFPRRLSPKAMRDRTNTGTTKMVRTLVGPLAADGLLDVRDMGRRRQVRLTSWGRLYAALSGLQPGRLRDPL